MARPDKVAAVDEVKRGLTDSAATLLTHYRGLSVTELGMLRAELRKTNARYRVVKNTLSRRAARDAGLDGLTDLIDGPIALVFCDDDPVGPAKVLDAFAKDHPALSVRGGYLDGEILDDRSAAGLAALDSREELLERLARLMHGSMVNFVRLINAPLEQQGRLIQALVDAGGAAGDSQETPAVDAEPAAEAGPESEEPAAEAGPEPEEPAAEAGPEPEEPAAEAGPEPEEPAAEPEESAAEPEEPAAETEPDADAESDRPAAEATEVDESQTTDDLNQTSSKSQEE